MFYRNLCLVVLVTVLSLFVMSATASDWTGAGSNNLWSNVANWAPTRPDLAGGGWTASMNISGAHILVDSSVTGSISNFANLYLGWNKSPVYLDITGGAIHADGTVYFGVDNGGSGILNMSGGSLVSVFTMQLGHSAGASGTINMTDGSITAGGMNIGYANGSTGTLNMTGGSVTVGGWLTLPEITGTSTGTIHLDGGVLKAGAMALKAGGHIDITGGTLKVASVFNAGTGATIQELYTNGYITAYGGSTPGNLLVNTTVNPGFITVTAIPEPATLTLLSIGLLGLFRRRK